MAGWPVALRLALRLALAACAAEDLHVLGLFPIDPDGKGAGFGNKLGRAECAEHFRLTAELINDHADGWYDELLPDDTVHIKVVDCDDVRGCQAALLNSLDSTGGTSTEAWSRIDAVLGPYSSSGTLSTLPISSYYNLPQVAYSATSPSLSGSDPYFFRVPPPDSIKADAMLQLLELFGSTGDWINTTATKPHPSWRAGTFQTDRAFGRGFATHFKEKWKRANGRQTTITGIDHGG